MMDVSKKPLLIAGLLATLTVALMAGCSKQQGQSFTMPPQAVSVVTLQAGDVTLLRELPGRVSAKLVAEVRPQVNGLVRKVLFTEGSQVSVGQVLYELDDAAYRATLNSAEANRLKAVAALEAAQRAAVRGSELLKNKLISDQDNDSLQATARQAQADLAAAEASVESAKINLGYARITAPISGRIGRSAITQGALVVANQADALATIQQLSEVYVDVTQSSSEWLQLRQELGIKEAGAHAVNLVLEDGSAYEQTGKLQFSDVTVDQTTGSFLLRILAPNPKSLLLPGMYVRAVIKEGVVKDAVLAPQQGITRDPRGNATALVVTADNKVELRTVTTSRTVGDQWLIASGLKAGERVIVEGLQKVQVGAVVQPSEAGAAPVAAAPAAPEAAAR